mgnify:CR=1 FL=1
MRRIYAYFLPQFHRTPENDAHWGVGFTEWTNVKRSHPLFHGHRQPLVPQFGYYDLSNQGVLRDIASYAKNHGVEGFAYWHYWFGEGRAPLSLVPHIHHRDASISSGFFYAWDNSNWTKRWVGSDEVIFEVDYSRKSAIGHFEFLEPYIDDSRYLRLDGKPVFQVIHLHDPRVLDYIVSLDSMLEQTRGERFHWVFPVGSLVRSPVRTQIRVLEHSATDFPPGKPINISQRFGLTTNRKRKMESLAHPAAPTCVSHAEYLTLFAVRTALHAAVESDYIPAVLSGWDTTPRYGGRGLVINGDIPKLLTSQLSLVRRMRQLFRGAGKELLLVKAWNEWAEGNILEPYRGPDGVPHSPATCLAKYASQEG